MSKNLKISLLCLFVICIFKENFPLEAQQHYPAEGSELCVDRPKALNKCRYRPSPYECAVLSCHVYEDGWREGERIYLENEKKERIHFLDGWEVLKTYYYQNGGYCGIVYINHDKKQIVIAHRGTNSGAAIWTDLQSIVFNQYGLQEEFLEKVLADTVKVLTDLKKDGRGKYALATTGHSLGGWLAQITVLIAHQRYSDILRITATTFDSPGAYPMLKKMRMTSDKNMLFDITLYFSSPNFINGCNPHRSEEPDAQGNRYSVGSLYRVIFKPFNDPSVISSLCNGDIHSYYHFQSHAKANFLDAFDPETGEEKECYSISSWPIIAFLEVKNLFFNWAKKEGLNPFFDLAGSSNNFHPQFLHWKDRFALDFQAHYAIEPKKNTLHIRHLPEGMRYFFENSHKLPHISSWINDVYLTHDDHLLATSLDEDIRLFADQMHTLRQHYPDLFTRRFRNALPLKGTALPYPENVLLALPNSVTDFTGREKEIDCLKKAFTEKSHHTIVIAPPITGFGGIGKSQLALEVVYQCAQEIPYDYVLWIPCGLDTKQSKAPMQQAYAKIYDILDLGPRATKQKEKVEKAKKELKKYFCLYVFDDASSIQQITPYLPKKGHVLITSRNTQASHWKGQACCSPKPFTDKEIFAFIKNFNTYWQENADFSKHLKSLISYLPRYPLALKQLFSLLDDKGYSPKEFLSFIEEDKNLFEALSYSFNSSEYEESMTSIVQKNLEVLKEKKEGKRAIELVTKLAFLHHRDLPFAWVLELDKTDTTLLKNHIRKSLSLLEKHSLLAWDRAAQKIHLHQTIQLSIRHVQFGTSPVCATLWPVPFLVKQWIKKLDEKSTCEEAQKIQDVLPHGRALFSYLRVEDAPELAIECARYLGKACSSICFFEESVFWAKKRLEIAKAVHSHGDHPSVAEALHDVGFTLYQLGAPREGLAYVQQALKMRQKLHPGENHPDVAQSLNALGSGLCLSGMLYEGVDYLKRALTMRQKLHPGEDHPDVAQSLNDVGTGLYQIGAFHDGLKYLQQALGMRKRVHKGKDHPDSAESLENMGSGLYQMGMPNEGMGYMQQALSMRQRMHQKNDHPDVARSLDNVGIGLCRLGLLNEGLDSIKQALAMKQRIYKRRAHPDVADSLHKIGFGLYQLGRLEQSIDYLKQALVMRQEVYEKEDHPDSAESLSNIGAVFVELRLFEKGLHYLRQALAMRQRMYAKQGHRDIVESLYNISSALYKSGRAEEGLHYLNRATEMEKSYDTDDFL